MPPKKDANKKNEVEDSASSDMPVENKANDKPKETPPKGKSKGGKNNSGTKQSNTANIGPSPNARNPPPSGFSEGNKVLEDYGMSVSGRKERVLSAVKTDKYFHLVEDSWKQLVDAKPSIAERFSFAEFRHCAALQLYQRLEMVKFEGLGVKPSAPTRIPLPRNLRVFQPIWSALAHIGLVDDDDLRVVYIPDGILPESKDLDTEKDVENLLSCTLYDWPSSWEAVKQSRSERDSYDTRIGYTEVIHTNEGPRRTREQLFSLIAEKRRDLAAARRFEESGSYRIVDGYLYKVPTPPTEAKESKISDAEVSKGKKFLTSKTLSVQLEKLFVEAKSVKEEMIRPRLDRTYSIDFYKVADGEVTSDPGAYGAWLHWDPQLWLDYEQVVEILNPVALFSLSMPVDTSGTYAWLIPVESRDSVDLFCKLPKASIPTAVWMFALILQSSTLPTHQRCTWYAETDRLTNLVGLRARYVRSAIKRAAPTEQYGTY